MVKKPPANVGNIRDGVGSLGLEITRRRAWQPIPIFLLEESHGQRSLAGYTPWGLKELKVTKAMVFPVVMFGCESWTVKKAER